MSELPEPERVLAVKEELKALDKQQRCLNFNNSYKGKHLISEKRNVKWKE